jgi:hypothetical protein
MIIGTQNLMPNSATKYQENVKLYLSSLLIDKQPSYKIGFSPVNYSFKWLVGLWKVAMLARAQILAGRRGPDDRPT